MADCKIIAADEAKVQASPSWLLPDGHHHPTCHMSDIAAFYGMEQPSHMYQRLQVEQPVQIGPAVAKWNSQADAYRSNKPSKGYAFSADNRTGRAYHCLGRRQGWPLQWSGCAAPP